MKKEEVMIKLAASILTAVIIGVGVGTIVAAESENDATTTVDDRLMETLVQGTLVQRGKEYVWVTEKEGKEIKLRVDKSTTNQGKGQVLNKITSNKTTKDTPQR
jgi:hypothetical protein